PSRDTVSEQGICCGTVGPGARRLPDCIHERPRYGAIHGNEREHLRDYLRRGGFLWADDNYGMDSSFRSEMQQMFPDHPLVELPHDHPIYHYFYSFDTGPPKIHLHDGLPAQGFGIYLDGRLVVFYTYQSDIGDGMESQGVHPEDSAEKHESALQMGINIVLFALSS
ncbi:MAG TPA: DUF4159 domain-containing protein, partial [bacterium]|nr:DUF4159 domain-containing protein [bacterium]